MPDIESSLVPIDKSRIAKIEFVEPIENFENDLIKSLEKTQKGHNINLRDLRTFDIVLGLHWWFKLKWNPKHKIPRMGRGKKSMGKCFGELYEAILQICKDFNDPIFENTEVQDPNELWKNLISEGYLDGGWLHPKNKEDLLAKMQKQNTVFRSLCSEELDKLFPLSQQKESSNTFFFLKAAFCLSEKYDSFRKNQWKNFLQARSNLVTEYRKPYYKCYTQHDERLSFRENRRVVDFQGLLEAKRAERRRRGELA